MSAMPDLLLRTSTEVQGPAKQSVKAKEPNNSGPSSFADVYARERQGQAQDAPAASSRDSAQPAQAQVSETDEPEYLAEADAVLAEGGNLLPPQELGDEGLDPLIAMALQASQVQVQPVVTATVEGAEPEPMQPLDAVLAPLEQTSVELEAEQVVLQAEQSSKSVGTSGRAEFAMAMAALNASAKEEVSVTDEALPETLVLENIEQLESLKESAQPLRPDQFVSKLNALTQAINQQSPMSRTPLVPGSPVAMQQGGWSEAVVDKVMWMSSQNLKSAEIQLDPAELGRLEVRVNLTQDQAQVSFASANAGVRDALEGQMHRLRELFAQQGLSLGDANVSDQSFNRQPQSEREEALARSASRTDSDDAAITPLQSERLSAGRGLVDYYA